MKSLKLKIQDVGFEVEVEDSRCRAPGSGLGFRAEKFGEGEQDTRRREEKNTCVG